MALRFLTRVTGRVGGTFLEMENITEGAGLGWGDDQINVEIGVQRRSMGWRYKFRSCQPICCVLNQCWARSQRE